MVTSTSTTASRPIVTVSPIAGRGPAVAALVASAALLLYGNGLSLVSPSTRDDILPLANAGIVVTALAFARVLGLRGRELGLSLSWDAVRWGVAAGVALALPPVLFIVSAPWFTGEAVQAGDINGLSGGEIAMRVTLHTSLVTALPEELLHRSVAFAIWHKAGGLRAAVVCTALLFSLWHGVIAYGSVADSATVQRASVVALGYAMTLVSLFVGGVFFALLRWRTGSVAAPALVHWIVVLLMYLAIWGRDQG